MPKIGQKIKPKPVPKAKPKCVACSDTGKSSNGKTCICQVRKTYGPS